MEAEALWRITFLYGLAPLDKFTFSSTAAFNGKRPIHSLWDSEKKEIPSGFYEVLMRIGSNGKTFTSADERLQIAMPTEGEESVHDFENLYNDECPNFFFFYTAQELRDAGYNPIKSPGFNYWNPEAIRWEIRGHVVEISWAEHRFYVVPDGYVAVCYQLSDDGAFKSKHPGLPDFTQDDFISASCFKENFCSDDDDVIYFIEFSLDELSAAGIKVPTDLTGYRFHPVLALFEEVEKPATPCGWDWITQSWRPICVAEDKEGHKCPSGNLAFPWESNMSDWILGKTNDVFTYMTLIGSGDDPRRNSSLMQNFFSKNGGPYCYCNCFCDNCRSFHLPWEKSKHRTYDHSSNVLSGSECD